MKITWFGHSCFRIDAGASSILIYPFLSFNQTFANAGVPSHHAIKGVTHVALTHSHEDHTDDTVTICRDTGAPLLAVGRGRNRSRQYRRHAVSQGLQSHIRPGLAFRLAHGRRAAALSWRVTADKFVDEMGQTPVLVPKVGVPFEV